jgi:hypothetical protein
LPLSSIKDIRGLPSARRYKGRYKWQAFR